MRIGLLLSWFLYDGRAILVHYFIGGYRYIAFVVFIQNDDKNEMMEEQFWYISSLVDIVLSLSCYCYRMM